MAHQRSFAPHLLGARVLQLTFNVFRAAAVRGGYKAGGAFALGELCGQIVHGSIFEPKPDFDAHRRSISSLGTIWSPTIYQAHQAKPSIENRPLIAQLSAPHVPPKPLAPPPSPSPSRTCLHASPIPTGSCSKLHHQGCAAQWRGFCSQASLPLERHGASAGGRTASRRRHHHLLPSRSHHRRRRCS